MLSKKVGVLKMKDYHIHSNYSDDCHQQPLLVACQTALAKGITEIALTEHLDLDYPTNKGDFQLDYEGYSQEIVKARNLFPQLTILKGLELGIQTGITSKLENYLKERQFDFVLGSIHTAEGLELYGGEFSACKAQEEAYHRYFEVMYECIRKFNNFQVLAHLDLIRRYGEFANKTFAYEDYADVLDEILHFIVNKDIGLEINTSGWRYGVDDFLPGVDILKHYHLYGGKIITFGSDAHRPEDLGFNFQNAYEMAKAAGFKEYAYFRGKKPYFTCIP